MQFRVLGPLEVVDHGEPLKLAGAKQRALLGALLLHADKTVSRDRLIDYVWGARAPQSAAHRLEEHVSRLRKLLHRNGESLLVTRPPGYLLRVPADGLDIRQFEQLLEQGREALHASDPSRAATVLREALALWRGPPLVDVACDAVAWPEIRGLEERRVTGYELLMEAELVRGRHGEIIDELEGLVRSEPLRERFRLQLMLALYRGGRQADALAAYAEARRIYAEQLGIEPGRPLKELEQAILRQDPSLELFQGASLPPLPTATAGNLPRPATSLVGREREIGEVLELLANGARLVTLTGPGGSGKTRLALEAAYRAAADFPAGAFWVGLAALRDPRLVTDTVAQVLGAREGVASHIGDRRLLLVIDNLEQLIEVGPELASVVWRCPNLYVLVTSRELLRLTAETAYEVLPLAEPEAIELFCVRGRAQPDATVVELCRRLDNLPLAIEFAAARAAVLSPGQILERISQRLDLLKGGRDAESRQLTLRATIEWSHELLTVDEQELFARLAVFAGGWTLEAAEEVASAELDTLQSLVEKSLVQHAGERFWMLETTREFGLEQLETSGETGDLQRHHAAYFAELAERAEPELRGPEAARWNDTLTAELDNLRAALSLAREIDDGQLLLRLAGALGPTFWPYKGQLEEGRAWIEQALAMSERPAEARIRALLGITRIAGMQGDHRAGRAHAEALLSFARECDDAEGIVFGLLELGIATSDRALYDEAARLALETDNERGLALVTLNFGSFNLLVASYEQALALSDRAAALWRRIGNPLAVAIALTNAGSAARELGRLGLAAERFEEALRVRLDLGVTVLHEIGAFAALELARGRLLSAARLSGVAQALCEKGFVFEDFEGSVHERTLAALREQLGAGRLETALAAGGALPLEKAVAYALEGAASEELLSEI